jgi:hypothetical protein
MPALPGVRVWSSVLQVPKHQKGHKAPSLIALRRPKTDPVSLAVMPRRIAVAGRCRVVQNGPHLTAYSACPPVVFIYNLRIAGSLDSARVPRDTG